MTQCLSDADLARLIRWLNEQPDLLLRRVFVEFGLLAGLRTREALALVWGDIRADRVEVIGKGGTRLVPLPDRLRQELSLLRDLSRDTRPGDRIFPPWHPTTEDILGPIGECLPGFSFHQLRSTFTYRLVEHGDWQSAIDALSTLFAFES